MCRDLGNRASLVNRAHMKRPSSLIFTVAGEGHWGPLETAKPKKFGQYRKPHATPSKPINFHILVIKFLIDPIQSVTNGA